MRLRSWSGKAHTPNEFGKLVMIQEAENQIVTHYRICDQRPADSTLLTGCLDQHVEQFGRAPERVAADPGFFSATNESSAQQMGVWRVSIPSHDTKSAARKQLQKQRWFKELQKRRTGCEGRISVLKRRDGLRRPSIQGPTASSSGIHLLRLPDSPHLHHCEARLKPSTEFQVRK